MNKSQKNRINKLKRFVKKIDEISDVIYRELVGKRVRIIDKKFNGQMAGTSMPSLFGREFTINWVAINRGGIYVSFKDFSGTTPAMIE